MKKYEVKVGLNKVVYEMSENRLNSFLAEITEDVLPYECKEITKEINRCGKWYITFKTGETRYCDTELEMYKTLYHTSKPVDYYGNIW